MGDIFHFLFGSQVQSLEITIDDEKFVGMPFVLLTDGKWINNSGSDFYIDFRAESKKVQKVVIEFL